MERMEVDQCAGATTGSGGGALRRSNSAPMITSVSDGMTVFSPTSSVRYRRSSVSVNPSCPYRAAPLSPFSLGGERPDHKRQVENMEMTLRGSLQRLRYGSETLYKFTYIHTTMFSLSCCSASNLVPPPVSHWHDHSSGGFHSQDSGVTPNSSPSPTRRFRGPTVSSTVRWPALTPLKRKGGVESDGPPKKLFVAGVTEPAHRTSYTVSVSQASADSPTGGVSVCDASPQGSPLSLSPPPSYQPNI
ncbi:P2R1A-PPP2R2A-interacting phosphatase regulator 1-like isoform X3 [Oncorhynchus nerka]|uniref:P2R1A-PPP2R2A-interacting phosphatase regulator 1-like isoform X3 n=1 Tax=Oncorhynchus nerka TaxID=8023 RepID=UPI001130725D|nr:protein FAM122A-like isoform X1 [Oncorhynchus nerka]XP_029526843.1 protein FAM122A-like isoform X1 [Oncorhynchus nerka]